MSPFAYKSFKNKKINARSVFRHMLLILFLCTTVHKCQHMRANIRRRDPHQINPHEATNGCKNSIQSQ
jgi:hypothetical protein